MLHFLIGLLIFAVLLHFAPRLVMAVAGLAVVGGLAIGAGAWVMGSQRHSKDMALVEGTHVSAVEWAPALGCYVDLPLRVVLRTDSRSAGEVTVVVSYVAKGYSAPYYTVYDNHVKTSGAYSWCFGAKHPPRATDTVRVVVSSCLGCERTFTFPGESVAPLDTNKYRTEKAAPREPQANLKSWVWDCVSPDGKTARVPDSETRRRLDMLGQGWKCS